MFPSLETAPIGNIVTCANNSLYTIGVGKIVLAPLSPLRRWAMSIGEKFNVSGIIGGALNNKCVWGGVKC